MARGREGGMSRPPKAKRAYPNTPAAEAKVEEALKLIEHAQNTLDRACQAICPVRGLVKEWGELGKLSDKAKAMWHHLNGLVGPGVNNALSLDSEPTAEEQARAPVPEPGDVVTVETKRDSTGKVHITNFTNHGKPH